MTKEECISYFKEKYPYVSDIDLEVTYGKAKERLLNTLFPYDSSITEIPSNYEYTLMDGIEEIIDLGNMRNFTSYSENGVSWRRESNQNINAYKDIVPMGGLK